jgi:hypothetical protein
LVNDPAKIAEIGNDFPSHRLRRAFAIPGLMLRYQSVAQCAEDGTQIAAQIAFASSGSIG